MENKHDYCSPSQLNLRFHCPGSVNLQKLLPPSTGDKSEPATRGIELHAIKVDVLNGIPLDSFKLSKEDALAVEWCVEKTQEVIARFSESESQPIIKKEFQIDLTPLGISGGKEGCRIDVLFVIPGVGSIVIDDKFGEAYVTTPQYNWQFKGYAWGAHNAFGGSVECIKLQPWASEEEFEYQSHLFEESDFEKVGEDINEIVKKTKEENAPLIRGRHCDYGFCKAKEICPLHKNAVLEIPHGITVKNHLLEISPEDRSLLYENLIVAKNWCDRAIKSITAVAIGENIELENYIIAERTNYVWKNEKLAEAKIREYAKEEVEIIEPAKLMSKSKIEKIIGKSKLAKKLLSDLLDLQPGNKYLKRDSIKNG